MQPGKPASQRGNSYPLICPSPWLWRRGDMAIIDTKVAFEGRKLSKLFVGHWINSLHPVSVYAHQRDGSPPLAHAEAKDE